MHHEATKLFLDFDGVICDSLEECFQSSWLTDHSSEIGSEVPPEAPSDEAYRAAFRACRPFIRSGEDYVVLHRLIAAGTVPESQAAFDRELEAIGKEGLAALKKKLYAVREALLIRHRARWLGWNPLYPGMRETLAGIAASERAYILSTKKSEFIAEILAFHRVEWPINRIIYSGTERKLAIIERVAPGERTLLIDDQVDHLDFAHPTCDCRVALWGYVTKGAVTAQTPALSLEEALALMGSFAS